MKHYDVIIVGTGPAGLGAAFYLAQNSKKKILLIDKKKISSGGLRNDCKQNYTYPVGFPETLWSQEEATELLEEVKKHLNPALQKRKNIDIYKKRAEKLGVKLLDVEQAHVGTDKASDLINGLISQLKTLGVEVSLETEVEGVEYEKRELIFKEGENVSFTDLILAPGRGGSQWLQTIMNSLEVKFVDNIIDIGVRIETTESHYPIVKDYYDPKFLFPGGVRTFCTNSGSAHIVKEKYENFYTVNGHSFSQEKKRNGLVNFAVLKTIKLTEPLVSGQEYADVLGRLVMQLGGGKPVMQRVGDFRMGKRSRVESFNEDLYDFEPTLSGATPGDVGLAIPAKVLRDIWKSLKMLDTIVPGVLHPSSIIYYPEIKTYANRPAFLNENFMAKEGVYIIGDGAGTSRGITAAWASGIKAGKDIA